MKSELLEEQRSQQYSVFLKGETVDLCVPSKVAIYKDGWADWFNDEETTQFLDQGLFPNTTEDQLAFYESLKGKSRFLLLIKAKPKNQIVGVISLSNINMFKRNAQIAMVFGVKESNHTYYALESMARVTEHGFQKMGLQRIYAGQAYPALKNWNQRLELLGYRSEGICRQAFIKGHSISDTVNLGVLYDDYTQLRELRQGKYWPGEKRMALLVKSLPDKGFAEILEDMIQKESKRYFTSIKYV